MAPLKLILLLAVCAAVNHFIAKPFPAWLALFPIAMMAAEITGGMVKWRHIREILFVRAGRLFVDETDIGSVRNAKIDLGEGDDGQLVQLIAVDKDDAHILVSTQYPAWEQADEIAKAIRAFLKERNTEQALPVKTLGTGP